jgi:hypothetical protein
MKLIEMFRYLRGPAKKSIDDEGFPQSNKLVYEETPHTQLITKEVLTYDRKDFGHVDGFDNSNIIIRNGLFNPHYYKIPRAKVNNYQNGKVLLSINKQDVIKHFEIKYPDYLIMS